MLKILCAITYIVIIILNKFYIIAREKQFQNPFIDKQETNCIQHRFGVKKMGYKVCGVFDAEKIKEEKKEKYYFTLTDFEQSVSLNAVNQRGEDVACICIISKKTGKITRIGGITDKLGFDLTWNGKVKVKVE
jgi:hypothetical protein